MAWFLLTALFVVSTYLAGEAAKRRGLSVKAWYWMGVVFGPLALIAITLMPVPTLRH
jgi:hypothetical protein